MVFNKLNTQKLQSFCIIVFCSHERVLEAITEEAEKRDIERFQPLLAGMNNHNIALKVHTYAHTSLNNYYYSPCVFLLDK